MTPLSCIICDGELEDAFPDHPNYNQPHAGTSFTSHGHYGSTVWDPMSSRVWLEINICDVCMKRKADEGVILVVRPKTQRVEYDVCRPWTGPEDDGHVRIEGVLHE